MTGITSKTWIVLFACGCLTAALILGRSANGSPAALLEPPDGPPAQAPAVSPTDGPAQAPQEPTPEPTVIDASSVVMPEVVLPPREPTPTPPVEPGSSAPAAAEAPASAPAAPPADEAPAAKPALFPRPPELDSAVRFWTDVFRRHDANVVVVHDRYDLGLVWETFEVPTAAGGDIDRKAMRAMLKERTEALRLRFLRLGKRGVPSEGEEWAPEDQALLKLVGGDPSRLVQAAAHIRTQRGIAGNVRLGMERAKKWLPQVAAILAEEGVPTELRALPFIESAYNPLARSSAGAAGLWQLMPATARQYGLKVNAEVDERLDVMKATRGAAKMLRQNFRMLGSWPLAITGYNHGPYGVKRAVEQVGSTDLMVLIDKYDKQSWGFASKNFYAEFLVALQIVDDIEAKEVAGSPVPASTMASAQ